MAKSPLKKELRLKGLSDEDYYIVKRLLNIKGQMDGLIKMIGDKRDMLEIIIQFKVLKGGIDKAGLSYINDHLSRQLKKARKKGATKKQRGLINELIKELTRF